MGRNPKVSLKEGDEFAVEITHIGTLFSVFNNE